MLGYASGDDAGVVLGSIPNPVLWVLCSITSGLSRILCQWPSP